MAVPKQITFGFRIHNPNVLKHAAPGGHETPVFSKCALCNKTHSCHVSGNNTDTFNRLQCLNHLLRSGLSAALFAPAWVWEVGNRLDWLQRQQQFWDKIEACWEAPRALVCQLPFSTCFDQGAGSARFSEVSLTHHSCTSFSCTLLAVVTGVPS